MINSRINFYLMILRRSSIELLFIDIVLFTVISNLNYFNFISPFFRLIIAAFFLQKPLLNLNFTKFIEPLFIISGSDIKRVAFINFFLNNLSYFLISVLLIILKYADIELVLQNAFVLNLLISLSYVIKFNIQIKDNRIKNSLKSVLYYSLIPLTHLLPYSFLNMVILLIVFFFLINYFNRSYNIYDIS